MKDTKELDWQLISESLSEKGFAVIRQLITEEECKLFSDLYARDDLYRNTINMQRYRFGKGEYKYFSYPLPALLDTLRSGLYPHLVPIANSWMRALSIEKSFPEQHPDLLKDCHEHGQQRPTPLILKYGAGGFNTLHQDLYGEIYFPFQVVIMLRQHGRDYHGGEFVMTEQVPRAQSIARVIQANQGDAVFFTTNFRPAKSARGYYRATMKHGISEVIAGERYALGIIFHDAK
jgi:hypothetical protein